MRVTSIVKAVLITAAVALPMSFSAAEAKGKMKLPPGACLFEKKVIATNTVCSSDCDPQTQWCRQTLCMNGTTTPVSPCFGTFCTQKCGGG